MTTSDVRSTPGFRLDWKAAIWAGLAAGAVFLMLEMAMVALSGQSPWGPPRMMAAIVLGKSVLPPPASFDLSVMMAAMAVHFMLSVILGLLFALGAALSRRHVGLGAAAAIGGVFGLLVYATNFYGMTAVFPWFAMARNLTSLIGHAVFGAVLGWAYVRLARPQAI